MKINCIIVDDEPLAREGLEGYVTKVPTLELKAMCENPLEANEILGNETVDLMFLDIQMPHITGIEFLKTLTNPPMVIITTAYPNFALEGYALNVLDYLVKPISFERFVQAVNKAKDYFSLTHQQQQGTRTSPEADYFFVKCENTYEKIFFRDILYIEGLQNYVVIHTGDSKYITYLTMKVIDENLPSEMFMRVHKSYIVSIPKITAIEGNFIRIGDKLIPLSRKNKDEILSTIFNNKLLKR